MMQQIRRAVASAVVAAVMVGSAFAAGKTVKRGPVAGEDSYRSASGYHEVVMEHCKAINKLARSRGEFNVALAREHAAEVSRNLGAASKHLASFLSALGPDQRSQVGAQSAVAETKQGQAEKLAADLGSTLGEASPDRKRIAAMVTELYLAEKDLVTAHKAAGKTLGIAAASAPRKPGVPRKRQPKGPATGQEQAANGANSAGAGQ